MPSTAHVSGTGASQAAAMTALATALGATTDGGATTISSPLCTPNSVGIWTCSILVFAQ